MMIIRTPRLTLRPPTMADAPAIARLADDFGIARMTGRIPHPYRLHHAREFIAWLAGADEEAFAVCDRSGVLGCCGTIPREGGRVEIGYWLGRTHWGKGIASEMATALVAHAFETRGASEVLVAHFDDNAASRRLILGQGFEYTHTDDAWCVARAANVPCLRYTLTREWWEKRQGRSS